MAPNVLDGGASGAALSYVVEEPASRGMLAAAADGSGRAAAELSGTFGPIAVELPVASQALALISAGAPPPSRRASEPEGGLGQEAADVLDVAAA